MKPSVPHVKSCGRWKGADALISNFENDGPQKKGHHPPFGRKMRHFKTKNCVVALLTIFYRLWLFSKASVATPVIV